MDLDTMANISDIVGIPIGVIGLILVLHQLYLTRIESEKEHLRMKNEMTLNVYSTIRKDLRIITSKIRKELNINDMFDNVTEEHIDMIMHDKNLRRDVSEMLGMLNKFAVGVKHDIFNIDILNELSGKYFIKTHNQFEPYLRRVRKNSDTLYAEYDILVMRLKEMHGYDEHFTLLDNKEHLLYTEIEIDKWRLVLGSIVVVEIYIYSIDYIPTIVNKLLLTSFIAIALWISIQLVYATKNYFKLI
jgi:hypothetical protein